MGLTGQTTVGCDAKIRVYDTSEPTPVLVKIMENVVPASETE